MLRSDTAVYDEMTGVLGLDAWNNLDKDAARAGSVINLIDIDNTGALNHIYGHQFGDMAIRLVAALSVVHSQMTIGDLRVFRVGGQEFVLLWSAKEAKFSDSCVDNLRKAVGNLGKELSITVASDLMGSDDTSASILARLRHQMVNKKSDFRKIISIW